ncbi:MAG: phosphoglucosamine mutase [Pseudomonadota bacterium]|nr:phosphoglucosamine mutase [Pseudomonadota bacterium]
MKKKYFGTDGIRGTVNKFPIVPSFFANLAVAIKKSQNSIKLILIGKDTRESCEMIENAIISGFKEVGVNCELIGVVSTPVLSFYTKKLEYDLGIMISASHNPYHDNGIKIFKENGEKLDDDEEIKIEKNIEIKEIISNPKIKKIRFRDKNLEEYENHLISKFSKLNDLNIKIVLDCANGSLHHFAPKILNKLGLCIIKYGCDPNGKNINKNCGALFPEKLSRETLINKADIGISFDGDADRVVICDEKGKIVDGDLLLAIIAIYLKEKKILKNNRIVSTKMSNLGFRDFVLKNNLNLSLSNVGDRYVIELMKKNKAILGGEQSGHIIFSENGYCGDGILTALFILQIISEKKCSLSELSKNFFQKIPQKLVNLRLKKNPLLILNDKSINNLVNNTLKNNKCDLLLRKSGTENLLRIMIQANSKKLIQNLLNKFIREIKKIDAN